MRLPYLKHSLSLSSRPTPALLPPPSPTTATLSAWSAPLRIAHSSMTVPTPARPASTASSAGYAPAANLKAAHHHPPAHHVHLPAAADYDTSLSLEARRYLRTDGLTPPGVDSFEMQEKRVMSILDKKQSPIEKYQYLSFLRTTNVHLFYRVLANNVKVGVHRIDGRVLARG